MPDLFHVIPVGDNSMLNGVFQSKNSSLALSFISNIGILLSHANHYTLVTGTSNNRWKHCSGSIISSKSSFAHARAVVNNESSNIFITHFV